MDANEKDVEMIVAALESETIKMKEEIESIYKSVKMCPPNRLDYCT